MLSIKEFFSFGVIDPQEPDYAKRTARFFDYVMLLVMFWLPLQWYLEALNQLTPKFSEIANWIVWSLFVLEALVMTVLVKRKLYYLITNWLNLIIIVALFPPMWAESSKYYAILRYIRLFVLIRLALPQLKTLNRVLTRNHFGATLAVLFVVTVLSGILVAYIDPEIGSIWNGIWWSVQTVTTVGYGDVIPNTGLGKAFGVVLMVLGVGLYSLVSANFAAYFVERGRRQVEKKPQKKISKEFNEIQTKLTNLEESNRRLVKLLEEKQPASSDLENKK